MSTKVTNKQLFDMVFYMDREKNTLNIIHMHKKTGSNYFVLDVNEFLNTIPSNDGVYKYGVTVDCGDIYIHTEWEY